MIDLFFFFPDDFFYPFEGGKKNLNDQKRDQVWKLTPDATAANKVGAGTESSRVYTSQQHVVTIPIPFERYLKAPK